MQAIHELGHVLGALLSGGTVERIVLHPLTISRTDLDHNPHPLLVAWAGPVLGVLIPVLLWLVAQALRLRGDYVVRFFAGFCLIANGAYLAGGSFEGIGDCGQLLRHGAALWHLWAFGIVSIAVGLAIWHRLGPRFGLGPSKCSVDPVVAYGTLVALITLLVGGLIVGGY